MAFVKPVKRWWPGVALVCAVFACGADTRDDVVERGEWTRIPDLPLDGRVEANIVRVGDEIVVFGGTDFTCPPNADCEYGETVVFTDGAAFSRPTSRWRRIASSPVPTLAADTAVIGSSVFVLTRGREDDARSLMSYDVGADRWAGIESPDDIAPYGAQSIAAVGDGLVLYSTTDEFGASPDWQFNPSDGTWHELPDDPIGPSFDRTMVWNGVALYLFGKALVPQPDGDDGPAFVRAARLRDGGWTDLGASDSIGPAPTLVAGSRLIAPVLGCTDGGQVNNFGRCIPYGSVLDTAADAWGALPRIVTPAGTDEVSFGGWSDSDMVGGSHNGGLFLDAQNDQWVVLPALDPVTDPSSPNFVERQVVAIGDALMVVGGTARDSGQRIINDAYLWAP